MRRKTASMASFPHPYGKIPACLQRTTSERETTGQQPPSPQQQYQQHQQVPQQQQEYQQQQPQQPLQQCQQYCQRHQHFQQQEEVKEHQQGYQEHQQPCQSQQAGYQQQQQQHQQHQQAPQGGGGVVVPPVIQIHYSVQQNSFTHPPLVVQSQQPHDPGLYGVLQQCDSIQRQPSPQFTSVDHVNIGHLMYGVPQVKQEPQDVASPSVLLPATPAILTHSPTPSTPAAPTPGHTVTPAPAAPAPAAHRHQRPTRRRSTKAKSSADNIPPGAECVQVITNQSFQCGGSMYVVPKSQPPALTPDTSPSMQQAGYTGHTGGLSAAHSIATPNMALSNMAAPPNLAPPSVAPSNMAPNIAPSNMVTPSLVPSNMTAGYRVSYPFKIPDHSQSHLYPVPHLKQGHNLMQVPSPSAAAVAPGTVRHSTQPAQVAAHSPHRTSQSPHRISQSPHMASKSPHMTSHSPQMHQSLNMTTQGQHMPSHTPQMMSQNQHMVSQGLHMTSQSPHVTPQSPHMTSMHITSPHLASPHMTSSSPHMSTPSPHFMPSHLTSPLPHLTSQHKVPHSPRLASPHLTTPSPRFPTQSPHMTSHSPHMTSQSPHVASQSPRLMPHSPHLPSHSPHLPPTTPQVLHHQRPLRIDAQEYGRPSEREASYVPLDLTTPKSMGGSSVSTSNADSPLDLSVKPNRKRDHDDDVIVVGEQLIPFKARRLPESYTSGYPYPGVQPGMHGHIPTGGLSGLGSKSSSLTIPHPSPYYYAPGGARYQSTVSPGNSAAVQQQHSTGNHGSAKRSAVWERQPQPPTSHVSPHHQAASQATTVRPEVSSSSAHMNGVRHTYPYTVSVTGNHGVVQHPHASPNVRGATGSIRYVYPTNSHQNNSGAQATPSAAPPQGTSTVCETTIRVPMSPTHRANSQERPLHGPPPLQTLMPQRTPPVEKLAEGRGQQPSHITMLESPGSVQSHLAAMQYVRGPSGVIQHVGPAPSTLSYDDQKNLYQPPGGEVTYTNQTHGAQAARPHSHNMSYPNSSSSSDVTITDHYLAQPQARHGQEEYQQSQPPVSGGTQLSIPKYSGTRAPASITSAANKSSAQPAYVQYHKVPPEGFLPPRQKGVQNSSSKDGIIGGSSSSGGGQVGRIQPFHQATSNGTSPGSHMPPHYHQAHPSTYPQHHLPPTAPSTFATTRGYIQVPAVQPIQVANYGQHLATTTTISSSTASSTTAAPVPRLPLAGSGVPAHIFSATVRPTVGQQWPMGIGGQPRPGVDFSYSSADSSGLLPKKPVANVNPIVQRKSPSLLHHKKQMLHQSRLDNSPGGQRESSMCQGTDGQANSKPSGTGLNSNQNNNMVSSLVSEARYSTFKHLLPATDRTQMEIKPEMGEVEKVPSKGEHLDFSKLNRGLDTFQPYEALIKLEQQEQLLKPVNDRVHHPPTELKIPNVPLKERMKPKDHFGRASPICMDEATKGAKLNKYPDCRISNAKPKDKAGKAKEPQNAKIHKYYSVKAKPSAGQPRKALMLKPKKCKKGTDNELMDDEKEKGEESAEVFKGGSSSVASAEGDKKPQKRVYRRKKLMDGFTKSEGVGRGRRPKDMDVSGPKGTHSRNTVMGEGKRKGKPRITKPLSDAKRRKQGAHSVVLTTRTRTQTAATQGVGRLSSACYNKNAAYERELKREEYRKIIKRFKRQNKRQRCGRDNVRVTRERLGVIFQSDSGSEDDDVEEDEDYPEGRGTPTSTTSQRSSRSATRHRLGRTGRYRKRPDPRDSNLDDDDDDDFENDFTDDYGDEDTTSTIRRSRGGRRGTRGSSRGGFSKRKLDDDLDDGNLDNDDDTEYRPSGNLSRFDFIDDEEDDLEDADDNEDEEQDDDTESADADESRRHAPPSRSKATSGQGLVGRPGRGRGGRVFRRRGGAWYDKRQKKKKPYTPKEKMERECLETRVMEDCTGQEALSAAEMARRLVICKETGETLLHKAARLGLDDVVLHCLQSGFDVNSRDNAGYTPLHETCVRGHVTAARMLIGHGADINANAHDGTRPMHDAVDNNNLQIVRLLLAYGVDTKLVSFGARDVMKLAKGDAMRQLLRGYFGDLNGANTERGWEEIPWVFSSSGVIDDSCRTGCDVLADVPPEPDSVEGYIEFDFCDTPHLPVYYLHIVPMKGALNYHLLDDVLSQLGCGKDFFMASHPHIEILQCDCKLVPRVAERQGPMPSSSTSLPSSSDHISDTTTEDLVDILELTNELRHILGVDTEQLPFIESSRKVIDHKDKSSPLTETDELVCDKEESIHILPIVEDVDAAPNTNQPESPSEVPAVKTPCEDSVPVSVNEAIKANKKEGGSKVGYEKPKKLSCEQNKPEAASRMANTNAQNSTHWKVERLPASVARFASGSCSKSPCSLPTSASPTTPVCPSGSCSPNVMARVCDFHSEVRPVPGEKKLLTVPLIAVTSGITSVTLPTAAKLSTSMVTAVMPLVQVSSAASVRLRTSTPAPLLAGATVSTTTTLSKPLIHSVPATPSTSLPMQAATKPSSSISSTPSIVKTNIEGSSSLTVVSSSLSVTQFKPMTPVVEVLSPKAKVEVPSPKPSKATVEVPSPKATVEVPSPKPSKATVEVPSPKATVEVPSPKPSKATVEVPSPKPSKATVEVPSPKTSKGVVEVASPKIPKAIVEVTSPKVVEVTATKPLTAKVDVTPPKPVTAVVTASHSWTTKGEMIVNNPAPDGSKREHEVLRPSPCTECPSKVDTRKSADVVTVKANGPPRALMEVHKDKGKGDKQAYLKDSIKQQSETGDAEKSHGKKVETCLNLKEDEVKMEVLPPGLNDSKTAINDTTPPLMSTKSDTIITSSLYDSCLIDVVARSTTSASADFNMPPLYTGVAFLSNIPLHSPGHDVSNVRVSQDFVIPTIRSQEAISKVLVNRTCGHNEGEPQPSGTTNSSTTHTEQGACGLPEGDSKCTNTKRLDTEKSNNSGCDQNISGSVSEGKPLTADQQLVMVNESSSVTANIQQCNVSPHHTLHTQRQQSSASSDMAQIKIADAPGSSLKQLAQKRQSGEERSVSPKAAETMPQEADDIPSACDGAATPSSDDTVAPSSAEQTKDSAPGNEPRKESNNNITSEEAPVDTALPVLERHERGENEKGAPQDKSVAEPTTDDSTDDMEMPQLTIQAY